MLTGIEAALWTETVRNADQLDFMAFPRVLALAERAWHKASWEDEEDAGVRIRQRDEEWEQFANTLGYRELKRLERMAVQYRLPVPGIQ